MSIAIQNVPFRNLYTATAGQTVFTVSFPFMSDTYLAVYQRGASDEPDNITQLLVLGVDYTVAGTGSETGGTITLTVGATAGDIIAILGVEPIDRTSVFNDLNSFTVTLNQQLNDLTIMVKQMDTVLNQLVPKYRIDELVSTTVRPLKLELPILNDRKTWMGQGDFGDNPDNIIAVDAFPEELLDLDFVLGTSSAFLPNAQVLGSLGSGFLANVDGGATGVLVSRSFQATANETTVTNGTGGGNVVIGIADDVILPGTEGFSWPTGTTAERPGGPTDGRARFNTTSGQWEGWNGAAWVNFVDTGGTVVSASYVTLSDESGALPASFSLGSLTTGLVLNTVALGVSTLTKATDGTDYLSPSTGATIALDNLSNTAINDHLIPDLDSLKDLGTGLLRWKNIYTETLNTGVTDTDTLILRAYDVNGAAYVDFFTLTAGNTPTAVLSGDVTGTTQAANDNSTKLATTAYADSAAAAGGATIALDNLAGVAINTSLLPGADNTIDLGSDPFRWNDIFAVNLKTGLSAADTMTMSAYDVDGAVYIPFITFTANNVPTCVLNGDITSTTQAPGDNSNKLATTAYADAAAGAGGANQALSNLASVAINTTLVSDTDVTDNLGTQAIRWNTAYLQNLQTGDTAADVLNIGAWDVDGAAISNFITLTAGNTPTCVLASGVTATTQAASDNSTKIATTAYVDAAASAGDSWVLLSSQTASASATIDFSNLLDSTYLNYVLVISGMVPATNNTTPYLRVGTGAGPSWKSGAADYQWALDICEATGPGYNGTGSNAAAQIAMSYVGITGATTHSFNAVLYIYNVTNTSTWKHINGVGSYIRNSNTLLTAFNVAGAYAATTAITSLRLLMSSGNISTGTFKLYGIKN